MQHTRVSDNTDNELSDFLAEVRYGLDLVRRSKKELSLWWDLTKNEPSELARSIRRAHQIDDATIRFSLITSSVVSLCLILEDNQSKNFAKVGELFRNGPLVRIITSMYEPLWDQFIQHYSDDMLRLRINRNNLFAHLPKDKHINETLQYSPSTAKIFASIAAPEHFTRGLAEKFTIIENSDVLGKMPLFSDSALRFLSSLLGMMSFAQEPEIQGLMEADISGHLDRFRKDNPLI